MSKPEFTKETKPDGSVTVTLKKQPKSEAKPQRDSKTPGKGDKA